MSLDVRFNLYHIEHSIIMHHFRQYFDKIYCLVIFDLIIIMGDFCILFHLFDTCLECYHWKNVCKQLKLINYRKWMVDYKIKYVVDNAEAGYHCKSCFIKMSIIATSRCLSRKCPNKYSKQFLPGSNWSY